MSEETLASRLIEHSEKYRPDTEEEKDFPRVYTNLGNALCDLARLTNDESLFKESFEEYTKALEYRSDYHEAYYNWGTALSDFAYIKRDESLFIESTRKYELATKFNEELHEAFNNWGNALYELWKLNGRREYVDEAIFKVNKAIDISPAPLYFSNKARMLLWRTIQEFKDGESERGIEHFRESLAEGEKGIRERFSEELQDYFFTIALPDNAETALTLLFMVRETADTELSSELAPFEAANRYWVEGRKKEVLDALPMDVAEQAGKVIEKGEKETISP